MAYDFQVEIYNLKKKKQWVDILEELIYNTDVERSTSYERTVIMVERFEKFTFYIFEITRYWHKLAGDEMTKYGLKGPHATYLTALYKFEDGITAPQLCELCGKDKADVSRMMSIMEKKGLVIKEGEKNYRATFSLTDEGKNAAEAVRKRAILAVSLAGKDLSEENRAILYTSLESIANNLKILSSSDAHYLEHLRLKENFIETEENSIEAIFKYLKNPC